MFPPEAILPVELLEEIFHTSLPTPTPPLQSTALGRYGHPLQPWPVPTDIGRARTALMLVCSHWAGVIAQSARLWTHLELRPSSSPDSITTFLERSRSFPVHVTFYFNSVGPATVGYIPMEESLTVQCTAFDEQFARLRTAASRWASFTLFAQEPDVLHTAFEALTAKVRPQDIGAIAFVHTGDRLVPRQSAMQYLALFPPPAFSSRLATRIPTGMSSVSNLVLRACRVDWAGLARVVSPNLTTLCLDHPYDSIALCRLLLLLRPCQALRDLRIAGGFLRVTPEWDMAVDTEPTVFAQMARLHLADVGPEQTVELLRYLVLPNVIAASFDLPYYTYPIGGADYTHILSLPQTSSFCWANVESLTLAKLGISLPISSPIYRSFFDRLVGLTDVFLDFRTLQIEYWEWLLDASATGALPCLLHATVAGLSPLEIQDLISVRIRAHLPPIHVSLIPNDYRLLLEDGYGSRKWLWWLRSRTLSFTIVSPL
ncbi:hypothetical protein C8Q76DRAFT_792786 [Earliella scabrosa]|nr:hypothetical protein C8Q76DRAFT_794666 [Earliella scabrosa]KAI0730635.1 hypothetical protein C8Q76DRAFT_792786 [Earliella scabrosa]